MNANTRAYSDLAKVEFVCRDCKEGNHCCPGYWTGLGLEIWCMCACMSREDGAGKDKIQDHDNRKLSTTLSQSMMDTRTVNVTNLKEASQTK